MTDHRFDQHLISGYLDGELTQQDTQRVRIHLEDCPECKALAAELKAVKEATMSTTFHVPKDDQWDESPRSPVTRWLQRIGWVVALVWLTVTVAYGVWQVTRDVENLWELVLVFGLWAGLGLVFVAVAVDQIGKRKNDKYRSVQK